jgi:hypothetical protein
MFHLLKTLLGIVILVFVFFFVRNWQVESSDQGKAFATSSAPVVKLEGFYKGGIALPIKVTWLGKKFDAKTQTGINVFDDGVGNQYDAYPFTTSVSTTSSSSPLYIDYNQSANPFWLRPVVDELVEITPGQYLGKLTVRIIPGYPFSLGFFKLQK